MPFRRLLGQAAIGLGWRPADFWHATPHDLTAALDYLTEHHGGLSATTRAQLRRTLQEKQWNSTN